MCPVSKLQAAAELQRRLPHHAAALNPTFIFSMLRIGLPALLKPGYECVDVVTIKHITWKWFQIVGKLIGNELHRSLML